MGTNNDYIPSKIADFHEFVINLVAVVFLHRPGTAKPYGFSNDDFSSLEDDVDSFKDAYDIANPAGKRKSRTSAQTKDMNNKRNVAKTHVRKFVKQWLANNPLVTDQDKLDMNLTVPDTERTKHPKPTTKVVVDRIDGNEVMKHVIHYHDELAENKAKPFGVAYCEIKYFVGIDPPDSMDDANLIAHSTETPAVVDFTAAQAGKSAFYFLRWVNTTGEEGPWGEMYFAPIRKPKS